MSDDDLIHRYDALKAVDMWESLWTSADSAIRALPAVTAMTNKYGNRNVPKMIREIETLRLVIRSEGTPAIQDAWDKVEQHIDYAYRRESI